MNPIILTFKNKPGILGSYLRIIFSHRRGLKEGMTLPDISAELLNFSGFKYNASIVAFYQNPN